MIIAEEKSIQYISALLRALDGSQPKPNKNQPIEEQIKHYFADIHPKQQQNNTQKHF